MQDTHRPRLTMSVEEAAELLGISRWLAYEQAQRGDLPVLRIGRRLRVPVRRLLDLVGLTWDEWLACQSVAAEKVTERPRGLAVVGGEEVAVDVERRGDVAVTEAATDRCDRGAGRPEVRRHEVPEVVETDLVGTDLLPELDEPVRGNVRTPWLFEVVVDEHERVRR